MSLLLAVPISLDAFRDFAKRLRTCAQPLSVGFWHLEAARFVMGIMSARLNGTDVLDHCMFAEALLTVVCTMKAGACLQKRCSAVHVSPWQRQNGVQLFLLCVKFNRKCHRRHFDLCCVCARFFATLERQVLLL